MYVFIGGTPVAGKSRVASKFIKSSKLKIALVDIDELRREFKKDLKLEKWVNYFWNKDEKTYWKNSSYESHRRALFGQSKAFFPKIMEKVKSIKSKHEHAIFEGVNLLPHLVHKHFDFPGFFLVNESFSTTLKRLGESFRWGKTEELQKLEAKYFIEYDARFIREGAKKYGYKIYNDSAKAEKELSKLFKVK